MKAHAKLAFLIICWSFSQAIAIASTGDLGKGIALYNQRQYRSAESSLARATVSDPTSAQAHYYLALTLVKLKQFSLAQRHFTMSSMLDPNGTFGDYSRDALKAYATPKRVASAEVPSNAGADSVAPKNTPAVNAGIQAFKDQRYHAALSLFSEAQLANPGDQSLQLNLGRTYEMLRDPVTAKNCYLRAYMSAPFTSVGKAAKQALMNLSASVQAKAHAPVDDAKEVERAVKTIQQQTADAQDRIAQEAEVTARHRINLGAIEAARISGVAHEYYRGFRRDPDERAEISNWERIQTMYQVTDAQAQADRARADGFLRQSFLQESANNLMSLIGARKILPDDAVLRALGTNLYVRYYGSPEFDDLPPPDPITELKATPLRLADFATKKRTSLH
jgi:tetratricopeptide (TPR) repeat protein